jgi:serine/threonine-protein kinase
MNRLFVLLTLLPACTSAADSADSAAGGDTGAGSGRSPGHYFPDAAPWYTPVTDAAVDPDNDTLIAALQARNWGYDHFQIDTSIDVLTAEASTERVSFTPSDDFYSPDCDNVPMPLPEGGNVEGESGYACTGGGDCHLLVRADDEARLYEMWRADVEGSTFHGGCLAVWDMDRVYPAEGRGDQCTSADAAGFPIAPLLFSADEVAAGEIDHAIRFILPNDRIRDGEFYHPASHATNADGGGGDALPYGAHLRLKPDFDESRIADPDALVVVHALQTYGMYLADGGNIALTAQSDAHTTHTWDEVFEEDGTHALYGIEPQDFEVLALDGPAIPLTFECGRTPL